MPKGTWREFDDLSTRARPPKPLSVSDKAHQHIRVHKTRVGKGGKTVTVISGLELDRSDAGLLLKRLKARCGTGGAVKGNTLELQGDQVEVALAMLQLEGYRPKKSGA